MDCVFELQMRWNRVGACALRLPAFLTWRYELASVDTLLAPILSLLTPQTQLGFLRGFPKNFKNAVR